MKKLGIVQLTVLVDLAEEGDAHGFAIARRTGEKRADVYRALGTLKKKRLVICSDPFLAPESRGKPRKVYAITDRGRATLKEQGWPRPKRP